VDVWTWMCGRRMSTQRVWTSDGRRVWCGRVWCGRRMCGVDVGCLHSL